MDIDEINRQLSIINNKISNNSNEFGNNNNRNVEDLKTQNEINERLNNIRYDINKYKSPNQNQYQYQYQNNEYQNISLITPQNNNPIVHKKGERDIFNDKINNLTFNPITVKINENDNLNFNNNYGNYIGNNDIYGIGIRNRNSANLQNFSNLQTESPKLNNRSVILDRMTQISPLSRPAPIPVSYEESINNILMPKQNNKPNFREINNNRLNDYTPLSRTLSIKTNENQRITNINNIPQHLINQNFNDINPKLEQKFMINYPENTR
jgi:hypothetical protein